MYLPRALIGAVVLDYDEGLLNPQTHCAVAF